MRYTYPEIARMFGFEMCPGGCWLSPAVHINGASHGRKVHWKDRRWTHQGVYRFLKLISKLYYQDDRIEDIYFISVEAVEKAATLHIRIPKKLTDVDRRELAWQAKKAGIKLPLHIQRWADKREGRHL